MHLDRQRARLGLALPLTARALPQAGQILLPDGHVAFGVTRAGVIHQHLQMHLRLAAQTLDIGLEVTLVRADRTAQRVVVLERSAETERQHGGEFEAVRDNAGMVFEALLAGLLAGLQHAGVVLGAMFGDDDS